LSQQRAGWTGTPFATVARTIASKEPAMDWHCIKFDRRGAHESEAAELVLALEDAYGSAGEPAAAEVFMAHGQVGGYAFYLSPEAARMAPTVLQRFHAVLCDPPADLHRCTAMIL
jgi:hypothetical protein